MKIFAPLAVALLGAIPVVAQSPQTARIPRIEADVVIDGALDEAPWRQAARIGGFKQYRPVDSRPAEDSTVVLMWYSPSALHVGIMAYDREPGNVRATLSKRDNIGSDDAVTIYLDTFNDHRRAYFFAANPLGVQDDGVRSEGGFSASSGMSGTLDRNPDFIYQTSGHRTDYGYVVEMRIPFKSLRYADAAEMTWGFNVYRVTQRTGYEDTWTDTRRANASFLAQSGTITGLHDLRHGVVTEVQPAVTFDAPGARSQSGSFDRGDIHTDVGGNIRFGFTNVTLDGTVNPDFSQVESDAGLVTLNQRFALFYPERRPFFLEGIELFASPNNLVYTRTIADPLGGLKITGKKGSWSLAHLSALDEYHGAPDAFASLTRVRRDLGTSSLAGLTLTDRERDGSYNRVLSGDARIVFGKLYYFQGQLAGSSTRDSANGDARTAPLFDLELDRTGRAFGFNYKMTAIDNDFIASSGFVPRTGIVTAHGFNRISWYGKRGALAEQFSLFGGVTELWKWNDFGNDRPLEGSVTMNSSLRLRGGWNVSANGGVYTTHWDPAAYAGYVIFSPGPVFNPLPLALDNGVTGALSGNVSVSTPLFPRWDASVRFESGTQPIFPEARSGHAFGASGTLNIRPTPGTRIAGTVAYSRLTHASDGTEFGRTIIPRVKVEIQPSRVLFVRVVAEYRSERQAAWQTEDGQVIAPNGPPRLASETNRLRMDWLLSYEPTPGTVAFFGYGSTMQAPTTLSFSNLARSQDGFFVKVAYLFRR